MTPKLKEMYMNTKVSLRKENGVFLIDTNKINEETIEGYAQSFPELFEQAKTDPSSELPASTEPSTTPNNKKK